MAQKIGRVEDNAKSTLEYGDYKGGNQQGFIIIIRPDLTNWLKMTIGSMKAEGGSNAILWESAAVKHQRRRRGGAR